MIRLADRFAERNSYLGYEQPAPARTWAADHAAEPPAVRTTNAFADRLAQMTRFVERHLR